MSSLIIFVQVFHNLSAEYGGTLYPQPSSCCTRHILNRAIVHSQENFSNKQLLIVLRYDVDTYYYTAYACWKFMLKFLGFDSDAVEVSMLVKCGTMCKGRETSSPLKIILYCSMRIFLHPRMRIPCVVNTLHLHCASSMNRLSGEICSTGYSHSQNHAWPGWCPSKLFCILWRSYKHKDHYAKSSVPVSAQCQSSQKFSIQKTACSKVRSDKFCTYFMSRKLSLSKLCVHSAM